MQTTASDRKALTGLVSIVIMVISVFGFIHGATHDLNFQAMVFVIIFFTVFIVSLDTEHLIMTLVKIGWAITAGMLSATLPAISHGEFTGFTPEMIPLAIPWTLLVIVLLRITKKYDLRWLS